MTEPAVLFALLLGIPLAGALVAGARPGRVGDAAAVLAALAASVTACTLVARHGMAGAWIPLGGLPWLDRFLGRPTLLFAFALDPLSSLVLLGSAVLGLVCVVYSLGYVGPANREAPVSADRRVFWFWMLLFVMAMAGLATSGTLVQLFVFWEITTVCSWALIGFYEREPGALAAAQKAFLMTAGGGLALLAAILVGLALRHSAGFDAISDVPGTARGAVVGLWLLLLAGAWAKSGQVPFHTWLPSAMAAPSPVSAYLHAASMVNAGVYLVLRLALATGSWRPPRIAMAGAAPGGLDLSSAAAVPWQGVAAVVGGMAVITIVVAVAQFFYQDDLKRLLALSTVSQLALVMLGASLALAGSRQAAQGAALHILAHGVGKALLFLSVGALSYAAGTRHIRDLSGVLRRAPVPAIGFLIGALTVAGVPPFACFWSKLLIVMGAVSLGGVATWAGALVVLESVVVFAWFLWVGQKVFLGRSSQAAAAAGTVAPTMEAALVILMVLCVAITAVALPMASAVGRVGFGG